MQINITLEQLLSFIKSLQARSGGAKYRALMKCEPVLRKSLLNNVFKKPHSDTVNIQTKEDLQNLIKSGNDHKPGIANKGAPYSTEYLRRKELLGEEYPHKYMDYGFWHGTDVNMIGESLVMEAKPEYHKGFEYLSHHEERRSVLKRAFLDAWQELIDTIIKQLAKEAQS